MVPLSSSPSSSRPPTLATLTSSYSISLSSSVVRPTDPLFYVGSLVSSLFRSPEGYCGDDDDDDAMGWNRNWIGMNIGSGSDVDLYGFYFINSKEAYNEEFSFAQSALRKIFSNIMSEINRMYLTCVG